MVVCILATINCFCQNPALISSSISQAPAVFPGGTATVTFRLNNNSPTSTNSPTVTVEVSLSKLDFTNSMFNSSTDIFQASGSTPFTWSYNSTTSVLTGMLNGTFSGLASNDFEVRNLNVTSSSPMNNPSVGASINIVAISNFNSNTNDDHVQNYTYTTTTLPVGLLSFEAIKSSDCASSVTWASEIETNFDYYQLEQSTDSKAFVEVGNSQAKKGSNAKYEQLVDLKSVKNNAVYFRLRMVDLDRTVHYSKIISLQNDCTKKNNLVIAPNPAKDALNIIGVDSNSNLFIFDMLGRLVLKATLNDSGNENINISNLAPGTYRVQVASGQNTYYHKLVKQ